MKTVLVTGASRGIGRAIAEKFLSEGWSVIGTSTSGKAVLKHQNLKVYKLDASDPQSVQKFVEEINNTNEKIDVLINNAGIYLDEDIFPLKREILQQTLDVNLIGLIDLTEKLMPLVNDGGHIINMSSPMGSITELNGADAPAYRISKLAINMFTRTLADELRNRKITVSSLDPGWVKTDMGGSSAPRDPSEPAKEMFELATSKVDSGYFWHKGKKRDW